MPAREKKEKKKTDPVPAEKLAEKLVDLEGGDDDFANDSAKKHRGGKAGKENGEARKTAGARAAKAAKDKARSEKAEKPGSRKLSAMARAAATAKDGLKRGRFETSDDPSSHGSIQKHAGGRPAKRHARAMLHSRFDAAATPGSPDVMTEHVPARWPEEDADPSPPPAYVPVVNRARREEARERRGPVWAARVCGDGGGGGGEEVAIGSQGERLPRRAWMVRGPAPTARCRRRTSSCRPSTTS